MTKRKSTRGATGLTADENHCQATLTGDSGFWCRSDHGSARGTVRRRKGLSSVNWCRGGQVCHEQAGDLENLAGPGQRDDWLPKPANGLFVPHSRQEVSRDAWPGAAGRTDMRPSPACQSWGQG